MSDLEFFTVASNEYFESLAHYSSNLRYWDVVRDLLPADWRLERIDIWLMARPPRTLTAEQGFKIHISATVGNAEEILRRVVPEYVREGVPFKLAADSDLLRLMGSKNYHRGSSGKFLVAYPQTAEHFIALIDRVHELTRDFEGPYILSDRRYKDNKVVHYRYGGFHKLEALAKDGRRVLCVRRPDGELVPDERLPYFKLPPWVSDPFPPEATNGKKGLVLKERYRIEAALSFTNAGGVYKGTDLETGLPVVVKEARPLTCFWLAEDGSHSMDAIGIRRREHHALRKLEGLPWVPKAIDLFQEWEHVFLVEELVEGISLTRYRGFESLSLVTNIHQRGRAVRFCREFRRLAQSLVQALREIHARRVVVGDLSPNNVLIHPETKSLKLIDLEGALDLDQPEPGDAWVSSMYTPGYRRGRRAGAHLHLEDDFFAAGMILFSMLLPVQSLFRMSPQAGDLFLDAFQRHAGLPAEAVRVMEALLEGDGEKAGHLLDSWNVEASVRRRQRQARARPEISWDERRAEIDRRSRKAVDGIAAHLLATYDVTRADRLWPGDIEVFRTNPLNVAYGAGGPLLLLKDLGLGAPEEVEAWLRAQRIDQGNLPPGLFLGLAGIAQVFAELGYEDLAAAALEQSHRSPARFAAADYFQGAAGWGMVQLWFHGRSGDPACLDHAREAGESILATAEKSGPGIRWRNPADQQVHFGLAYGASGVALFLASLYQATGEERFREAADAAIRFEVSKAQDPKAKALQWINHEGAANVFEPYWLHGSAGIASSLIRCHALLGEPGYRALAERAAARASSRFSVQPTLFNGLSGLGEMNLDLFQLTGDETYLRRAYDVAESVLLYAVERAEGIAFPGRLLRRLSNDYGTGSSGVGLFLNRLLKLAPRRFHDLTPPSAPAPSSAPDGGRRARR